MYLIFTFCSVHIIQNKYNSSEDKMMYFVAILCY